MSRRHGWATAYAADGELLRREGLGLEVELSHPGHIRALDILYVHERMLALGALCWAAAGKDPGFTPIRSSC
jgi:hypothetical protein